MDFVKKGFLVSEDDKQNSEMLLVLPFTDFELNIVKNRKQVKYFEKICELLPASCESLQYIPLSFMPCSVFSTFVFQEHRPNESTVWSEVTQTNESSELLGLPKHLSRFKSTYFMNVFQKAFLGLKLDTECAVLSLIYLDRIIAQTMPTSSKSFEILLENLDTFLICCLLLASKMHEDQSAWNAEFSRAFPKYAATTFSALEGLCLEILDWNLVIEPSAYIFRSNYLKHVAMVKYMDNNLLRLNRLGNLPV